MSHKLLDIVVLNQDLPKHGLVRGDIGTLVELMPPDGVIVEFVAGDGTTQALVTMRETCIRALDADEVMTARRLRRSA